MAITRVAQSIKSGNGSGFDHSKASDALNVPAGALIVVKFSSPQGGNIATAPTDTAGNTYVTGPSNNGSNEQALWYCLSATANAANVVTAAFSNGVSEYGYSVEVYTGGTWTYDSTNSGVVAGAFTTSPTVSPSLSTSGAGVIATCFGQYDWPRAGNSATQSPGSVINSGGDGTTVVMASGEVINTSAFGGTISVNIQQPTPANTKCDLLYASFLSSGGGGGSSTGTLNATLADATASAAGTVTTHGALSGTLAAAVLAAAGIVAIAGSGGGTLGSATLAASGTVPAHGTLSQTLGAATASGSGTVKVSGNLSRTLGDASLSASGTVISGRVGQLNATLAAATLSAHGTVATHGTLAQTLAGASLAGSGALAIHGSAVLTLDPATGAASGTVPITGNLNATLAPATLIATGRLPGASLPPDPLYFIRLPARSFYVAAPARSFYAAAPARSFYVLSNPNMTQTFIAKDPGETVVITLDASLELDSGETLTQITGTHITTRWGTEADASLGVADPQINGEAVTVNGITIATGHAVQAVASAGLDQCGYFIAITCNTSNPDKVLVLKGILPVNAQ